ncbi:hypothetical protein F5Y06DRAFT_301320 [Hypoxylon sp. FL0890]|nr:hypothetical protein F5Y06DRAFT_301320 [Hypoxylon sp. FL0890]
MGRAEDHLYAQVIPKKGTKENPINPDEIEESWGAPGSEKNRRLLNWKQKALPTPDVIFIRERKARNRANGDPAAQASSSNAESNTQVKTKAASSKAKPKLPKEAYKTSFGPKSSAKRPSGQDDHDDDGTPPPKAKRAKAKAKVTAPTKRPGPPDGQLKYPVRAMDHLMARVTDN